MKTEPVIPINSVDEILRLIDGIKNRGGETIKIPGFEFTWRLAQAKTKTVAPSEPGKPVDKVAAELGDYEIPIGKYRGRLIKEVPRKDLRDYCDFLWADSNEGKTLNDDAYELVRKADRYLTEEGR